MTARAESTKKKILAAAEEEFAEKGLYGARVDEIAARAEINKRMLYAYFGDKEQLYVAALEAVYARLAAWEQPLLSGALDTDSAGQIRTLIRSYFIFLSESPSFVRLVMWENLNGARYLARSNAWKIKGETLGLLRKTLQTGVENGSFRADIDIEEALLSINLFSFSYFSNIHTFARVLQTDLATNDKILHRADHVADMVLAYLT